VIHTRPVMKQQLIRSCILYREKHWWLYKKWLQYHNWSFCPCELKQEALYVLLICYLPSIQVIYDMCISDMISTFMTSVFLRHDINIYKISVFQTRHVHLRHQCFSLYNIHDLINYYFITGLDVINVDFTPEKLTS
jgi:hypothetical protein